MGAYDTPSRRRLEAAYGTPGLPEPDDGEIDLLVYCTVAVPVTMALPYSDAELAEVAAGEVGWSARFVSVDHVDVDTHDRPAATLEQPRRPGRGFLDRLRRV